MVHATLSDKLPEVFKLLEKHQVKQAYAFGSTKKNNWNQKHSCPWL